MDKFWGRIKLPDVKALINDLCDYDDDSPGEATVLVCHTLLAFHGALKTEDYTEPTAGNILQLSHRHGLFEFENICYTDAEVFAKMAQETIVRYEIKNEKYPKQYESKLRGTLKEYLSYPRMRVLEFMSEDARKVFFSTPADTYEPIAAQVVKASQNGYNVILELMAQGDNYIYKELCRECGMLFPFMFVSSE